MCENVLYIDQTQYDYAASGYVSVVLCLHCNEGVFDKDAEGLRTVATMRPPSALNAGRTALATFYSYGSKNHAVGPQSSRWPTL